MTLFKRLFQRSRSSEVESPRVRGRHPRLPEGVRVYVIGDVHGRVDLLRALERRIVEDERVCRTMCACLIVYLGDFVDRGFDSRAVLDHLIARPVGGFRRVCLIGNHDAWLRDFLDGVSEGSSWLRFGGEATLASYGVALDFGLDENERLQEARRALEERVPEAHRRFIAHLDLAFSLGDYFFCHAGIRPNVPLAKQSEQDLLWIREPFLSWSGECGKIVIHGHTVEVTPVVRRNRIGIDTGACFTGVLTALVLEGEEQRFLSTQPGAA